jgi:ABC-type antimicrobial peptide transport system permease subunit
MYMSVTDKTAEFSTMRVLGISRIVLFLIIFFEGIILIIASQIAGNILLKPASWIISSLEITMSPNLGTNKPYPLVITADYLQALKTSLVFLLTGILGSALPGINVIRLRIIKGLSAE